MLEKKIQQAGCNIWLVNTGWIKGKFEENGQVHFIHQRIPLKYTRAILDAIHNGELSKAEYTESDLFKLKIPKGVTGVPSEILDPSQTWVDKTAFKTSITSLAEAFIKNSEKFKSENSKKFIPAGPQLNK